MGCIVITTIQRPTRCLAAMVERARDHGHTTLVVGDRKTPDCDWPQGAEFMGIAAQRTSHFALAAHLPENHYARKNLGYLAAMARHADFIFDTDDDNEPLPGWRPRGQSTQARECKHAGWVNTYRWFTPDHIWPRGLPLQEAHVARAMPRLDTLHVTDAPVQQGLANGSPDVDAAWRLLMDHDVRFGDHDSIRLAPGAWCPFNSQSTWWFAPAYPLMYLPSFVSFRMTDIWRSFVAQRCLWAMGHGVVFHGAEMFQERNEHNLLRDFEQEVPGYLGNERFRQVLDALELEAGSHAAGANLRRCYHALEQAGLIERRELALVDAWLQDTATATGARS
jgi:hypothetical protein